MRAQPLLVVRDVAASSAFYQRLLGCTPGGDGRSHHGDGPHEYQRLYDPRLHTRGADFDAVVARARELEAPVVLDVHHDPNANHRELWLSDPDGYTVVVASPDGADPAGGAEPP